MNNPLNTTCFHLILGVGLLSVTANAVEPFTAGAGTPNDPYEIETAEQLLAIGQDRDLLSQCYVLMSDLDLAPNLSEDWVFSQAIIAPGDVLHAFTGIFNGNKHTIRNLVILSESAERAGLFGSNRGLIRNLSLEDCDILGSHNVGTLVGHNYGVLKSCFASGLVTGVNVVGGLVGQNQGLITHCSTHVSVTGDQNDIGGLVGQNGGWGGRNPGIIETCKSQGSVNGSMSVGGLIGYDNYQGLILECTSLCDVTGNENVGGLSGTEEGSILRNTAHGSIVGKASVGGLVGQTEGHLSECLENVSVSSVRAEEIGGGLIGSISNGLFFDMSDCYSIGDVQAGTAGGFIGQLKWDHADYPRGLPQLLTDCYAAVVVSGNTSSTASPILGGFIGHLDYNSPWRLPFYSSMWDTDLSGQASSVGLMTNTFDPNLPIGQFDVSGKTTAQMTDPNTFITAGWDFQGTWSQLQKQDYPSLAWEHIQCE